MKFQFDQKKMKKSLGKSKPKYYLINNLKSLVSEIKRDLQRSFRGVLLFKDM